MRVVVNVDLIVITFEKWDGVSRSWQIRSYVKVVVLLVIDEIYLLGILNYIIMFFYIFFMYQYMYDEFYFLIFKNILLYIYFFIYWVY